MNADVTTPEAATEPAAAAADKPKNTRTLIGKVVSDSPKGPAVKRVRKAAPPPAADGKVEGKGE
jgi:hypothetical protein